MKRLHVAIGEHQLYHSCSERKNRTEKSANSRKSKFQRKLLSSKKKQNLVFISKKNLGQCLESVTNELKQRCNEAQNAVTGRNRPLGTRSVALTCSGWRNALQFSLSLATNFRSWKPSWKPSWTSPWFLLVREKRTGRTRALLPPPKPPRPCFRPS